MLTIHIQSKWVLSISVTEVPIPGFRPVLPQTEAVLQWAGSQGWWKRTSHCRVGSGIQSQELSCLLTCLIFLKSFIMRRIFPTVKFVLFRFGRQRCIKEQKPCTQKHSSSNYSLSLSSGPCKPLWSSRVPRDCGSELWKEIPAPPLWMWMWEDRKVQSVWFIFCLWKDV